MEEIAEVEEMEADEARRKKQGGSRSVSRAGSEATVEDDYENYDNFVS
jgi:hypothetical protein